MKFWFSRRFALSLYPSNITKIELDRNCASAVSLFLKSMRPLPLPLWSTRSVAEGTRHTSCIVGSTSLQVRSAAKVSIVATMIDAGMVMGHWWVENWQEKNEVLGDRPVALPLSAAEISLGLPWDRSLVSAVKSGWLSSSAASRPGCLFAWLIGCWLSGLPVGHSVVQSLRRCLARSVVGWFLCWSFGPFLVWLFNRLVDWLNDWSEINHSDGRWILEIELSVASAENYPEFSR